MPTYDLSHQLEDGMPVYPGDPPVEIEPTATLEADGYRTTGLSIDTHAGTHVDAPAHLVSGGRTLEEYSLETFRFTTRVVDCRPLEDREPIDADALRDAYDAADTDALRDAYDAADTDALRDAYDAADTDDDPRDADLLLVRTGWETHWGTDRYFDHPYLTADAADYLLERRCHLGVDAPNVDPTPTPAARADEPDGYPVHHALLGDGRLLLENLCGLAAVPETFELHAYPLNLGDADGAPVRAVAVLDEE
ncbi:cyclase family protein [Natronobeatus ordinarius]|uniref:cyclase family protein n=1 Tax=Natronobeatus ordinarius TaxID=2963433 RepID=UPI0020CC7533|nr:cyclase family protein [Natronobeatus ordinarius]